MPFKSLNKKPALTNQKSFILGTSFIKIGSLLFPIKLFKYASTMSIYSIKNPKSVDIAKKIFSDLRRIFSINVSLKLMPSI